MTRLNLGAAASLALAWLFFPCAAHAAESYDNCTGFITSLPAVITTQGTWCMKSDLTTAITSGQAITINTNNVTIDCNDFKLGGLAAGIGTSTYGIYGNGRQNLTARHCNIRGFLIGLLFGNGAAGSGHVVEDNRFTGNTLIGIAVGGDGSVIRRNQVADTGGSTQSGQAEGIEIAYSVDILDNEIFGVTATSGTGAYAYGISGSVDSGSSIIGNRIRGIVKDGPGNAYGISVGGGQVTLRGNDVIGDGSTNSTGLDCTDTTSSAVGNVVNHFDASIHNCTDGGNTVVP